MKKIIVGVATIVLAAVNVSFVFDKDESVINLTLANIVALATGEDYTCSICGEDARYCNCDHSGITCDHEGCNAKVCHYDTKNWACRCAPNGNPLSLCAL